MFVFVLLCITCRRLVALLLLSYRCIVTINVLWLFLTMVPWVGLQYAIVVFPDHTHFLTYISFSSNFVSFQHSEVCFSAAMIAVIVEPWCSLQAFTVIR